MGIFFEAPVIDKLMASNFHLTNCNKTDKDENEIHAWVNGTEMDKVWAFFWIQNVNISVQTSKVKENYDERVQGANGMIWLPLLDVCRIRADQKAGLEEFDDMNATNEIVITGSYSATKVEDTDNAEEELQSKCTNTELHQRNTRLDVEILDLSETFDEFRLFFHKS